MLQELLLGFARLHILYHASKEPVYGLGLQAELGRHGYRLSPGTLYPILNALEKSGYLLKSERVVEGKVRKYYVITNDGLSILHEAQAKVRELASEVLGNQDLDAWKDELQRLAH
ncbi:MAG: helix-turn-helix transcriptional regulator [Chloroflexi bacterium]|nr:helix-turn-helix transcriptional regulator [Chloroflexota bacterium]